MKAALKLVYPPEFSIRMLCSSTLLFGTLSFVALSEGQLKVAAVSLLVAMCSMNYWRHPVKDSIRRYVDIAVANTALCWFAYIAIDLEFCDSFVYWGVAVCFYLHAVAGNLALKGTKEGYHRDSRSHVLFHSSAFTGALHLVL